MPSEIRRECRTRECTVLELKGSGLLDEATM